LHLESGSEAVLPLDMSRIAPWDDLTGFSDMSFKLINLCEENKNYNIQNYNFA
jgi:hypothetical protein